MHELSICQELMTRVEQVALENRATSVDTIFLSVGPLSGVEAPLLRRAFQIACLNTIAESAELVIRTGSVVIQCNECGASSEVRPNHLVCGSCKNWRVQVTQGEELLILRLELSGIPDHPQGTNPHPRHSGSAQSETRHSGSAQPHPESIASQGEPPHV